jgi:hypothetical protein
LDVPASTPPTIPVEEPTVALAVVLLVHVPPVVELKSVVVPPAHTLSVPPIAAGRGFTVIDVVLWQPVGRLYVIVAVPVVTPVTVPVADPTATLLLPLHVPPGVLFVKVTCDPTHTLVLPPAIPAGKGFTVNVAVLKHPVLTI